MPEQSHTQYPMNLSEGSCFSGRPSPCPALPHSTPSNQGLHGAVILKGSRLILRLSQRLPNLSPYALPSQGLSTEILLAQGTGSEHLSNPHEVPRPIQVDAETDTHAF